MIFMKKGEWREYTINDPVEINVREYRGGSQTWTIQRNWQHRIRKTKTITTQYVLGHRYIPTNTAMWH